ncbi:MAG: hypothetical protein ACQEVT_18825 [Pseudomonadota bacterium]|uniref:hypothetical protein n=1 Tax=Roseovarius TaxID=74030 RepID=UPI0022A879B0|nr:hypothetical protein [Roseovarius sp. EGI FJ00037]MCZ0813198.1 hypothetical protein [Roseovarius sp. EGI FJ00037]
MAMVRLGGNRFMHNESISIGVAATMNFLKSTSVALLAGLSVLTFAPVAQADSSNKVKFRSSVTLKVGQAAIVHGARGECGQLPSKADLARNKRNLDPTLKTGHIVFGKLGVRKSGGCKGRTPVYETIFVADRPGKETVKIHGDTVRITVK